MIEPSRQVQTSGNWCFLLSESCVLDALGLLPLINYRNSIQLVSLTYRVSATEDTVLVQSGTKALVCAATCVTILPCKQEAKTSHDGVFPLIRELLKIAVVKAIIWNVEHSQHHFF